MESDKSIDTLIKQYEDILDDTRNGRDLSSHLVTVISNLKSASDQADRYWPDIDNNNYRAIAALAYEYYRLRDMIIRTIKGQVKFN